MRGARPAHRIPIVFPRCSRAAELGKAAERIMLDIIFVLVGVGWLGLCVGYAFLCERL
jgi:hypothetical protein